MRKKGGDSHIRAVLCLAEKEGKILMLHRRKEPNRNYWVLPGTRLSNGERTVEAALRALREETGLNARRMSFKGELRLIEESKPQWNVAVFHARNFNGKIRNHKEGRLEWVDKSAIEDLRMCSGDKLFIPHITSPNKVIKAMFHYNKDNQLVEFKINCEDNGRR